ncbi:MAG TPA: aspartate/glutamate racemase family protein [Atribacterota bacterium]|nr:aspartate/glutamate racemase family protein [Atribacterota bacterium]
MKIFIINPNADRKFTEMIKIEALKVISPGNDVVCKNAPNAPMFIGNHIDEILCGPGMLQLLQENEKDFDVFVLGCTCDVNIDIMRETTEKPVVGIGESSMLAAMMLGGKFSVIQMGPRGISMKKRFIKNLGFDSRCASVRSININGPGDMADKIIGAARKAIEEDGAEVITLGCAGLAGLAEKVSKEIGIPVIDGIPYGVRFAEALVACGGKTSKKGLYGPSV